MNTRDRKERLAGRAQRLLDNPDWQSFYEDLKGGYESNLARQELEEPTEVLRALASYQALISLDGTLRNHANLLENSAKIAKGRTPEIKEPGKA